jgi:hypothetical protein
VLNPANEQRLVILLNVEELCASTSVFVMKDLFENDVANFGILLAEEEKTAKDDFVLKNERE